jgi:cytochrome b
MADQIKKKIWDLPTRVFHWALMVCVLGLAITGELGGEQMMPWHFRLGYTVLSLLLFRLVWGFVGGHWSRFNTFFYSPVAVWRYARGRSEEQARGAGHNPLGALAIFALLAVLAFQVASGLVSDDEIAFSGPLAKFVSGNTVSWTTSYHRVYGKYFLLALVLLHVAAILFYLMKRRLNLIAPMLDGHKLLAPAVAESRDDTRSRLLALAVFAACAGAVAGVVAYVG